MQVITQNGPVNAPTSDAAKAAATRERAINAYLGKTQQAQAPSAQVTDLPVADPNRVDAMELQQITERRTSQPDNNRSEAAPAQEEEQQEQEAQPKEDLKSQYEALARREKALRAQRIQLDRQYRAREEALKAREEAAKAAPQAPAVDMSKYVSLEDLAKDPFEYLAQANLSYEQLVEQAVNAPKTAEVNLQNTIKQLQTQVKSLQDKLDGTDKKLTAQEQAQRDGAIVQIRQDVNSIVKSDPAFETIRVTGQSEEVVKLIISTYDEGMGPDYPKGTLLDPYEAAKMIEDEVAESLYGWASKAPKVAKRFKQSEAPAPSAAQKNTQKKVDSQPAPNTVQMRTLTNNLNGSRQMTARERAILAAEGKLNNK